MAVVIIYNGLVLYLLRYLKNTYNPLWLELGSPSFLNNSILNGIRVLGFLFGNRYKSLNDPKLANLIWIIRGLFLIFCFAFAALIFGIFTPAP